jgi:proline iminopeptidase
MKKNSFYWLVSSLAKDKKYFLFLIGLLYLMSCTNPKEATIKDYFKPSSDSVKSGGVKMISIHTPKGNFNVWTKRFGNNPTTRVLLLHGGPGGTHECFESFESFLPQEGIEFIYYDQLDSYNSDKPNDSSLWTNERFVEEVEQVRKALQLDSSNFYLLGHSWGGILAMEYALKYQQNLKGLIISNMMSSCPQYQAYNENVLQKLMDKKVVDSILNFEKTKTTSNPRYMDLLMQHYYNLHVCRVTPFPEPINRMFSHLNPTIYTVMQGPSEFGISGRLANWDRTNDLPNIKTKTLVIRGMHDTMDPAFMEMMSKKLPNGSLTTCPNGGHCSMWDDQENYFKGLIRFLKP